MGAKMYCYQELTIKFSGLLWTIDVNKNLIVCTMVKQIILKAKPTNTQNISFLNYFTIFYYYLCSYDYLCLYSTLWTKVCIVKAMVFPVVMYRCESWIIKKAEGQRTDAFKLWCQRRLLRVLGQQGHQLSQSSRKSTLNIHWKDWWRSWSSSTLATWCEKPTH